MATYHRVYDYVTCGLIAQRPDHTFILSMGYLYLFKFVFQGRRCVLKDCCAIADDAVLPPETVVPSFTYYAGSPGDIFSGTIASCNAGKQLCILLHVSP